MLDIKKLVTSFLIVAAITASSIFIFENSYDARSQKQLAGSGDSGENAVSVGSNAFVEAIPENTANPKSGELAFEAAPGMPPFPVSDNLTQNLAQSIAGELLRSNPSGPLIIGDEPTIVVPPSMEDTIGQQIQKLQQKDIYLGASVDDGYIKIKTDFTAAEINTYLLAASNILAATFSGPEFENLSRGEPGPEMMNAAYLLYAQAEEKMYQLEVPKSLLEVHKAFISFVNFEKMAFDETARSDDPIKFLATINNYSNLVSANSEKIVLELKNFEAGLPKTSQKASFENRPSRGVGVFLKQLFVKTALAFPVEVISDVSVPAVATAASTATSAGANVTTASATTGSWLQKILEWAKKLATEIVKDRLVHMMVQQIIGWVQGGGKPQFITNWKGFLASAGNEAAGLAIQEIAPGLCRSFSPLIRVRLESVYLSGKRPVSCTLDQVVGNIQNFYRDFASGGWVAYSATVSPGGNYFGSLFETAQIVDARARAAKEAALAEGQSGKGFESNKTCVKSHTEPDPNNVTLDITVCDQYEITTPGSAAAGALDTAIGAPLHRIVNAQDIVALVNALVNSALSRLIQAGTKGISGLLNSSGSGGGSLSGTCNGLTGQALTDCRSSAGSINQTIQDTPTAPATSAPGTSTIVSTTTTTSASSTDPCEGLIGIARNICVKGEGGRGDSFTP